MNFFKTHRKEENNKSFLNFSREVHNEIFSAQNLLIAEAENSAGELMTNTEKEKLARELYKIGFTNAANVGKQIDAIDKREAIRWYEINNPNNKFIDEESVKKVCEKYNLYLCDIQDYISDIPLKNQKEIADFRIKETALRNSDRIAWVHYNSDLIKASYEYKKEVDCKFRERDSKIKELDASMNLVGCCDLRIIAPESKIDMRYKQKVGHQIVKDDPVVLQPVKWGYLIVTAWGDEASDELIVNEKHN